MRREDIIRMAREAGLPRLEETDEIFCLPSAICFAALVAAAEREAIAEAVSQCDPRATPKGIAAAIRARGA